MRSTQATRLARLHATIAFLDEHADRLPAVNRSNARRRLDALAATVSKLAGQQKGSDLSQQSETHRYQELRDDLIQNHIGPIVDIARSVLIDDQSLSVLRMPRGNPNPQKLAAAAEGLAKTVQPHAAAFINAGLEEDFLVRLREASNAMLASYTARTLERASRKGATTGIRVELAAAGTVVRVLGRLVYKEAGADKLLIGTWSSVAEPRRIGAGSSPKALRAPRSRAALSAPNVKLLRSGDASADRQGQQDAGSRAGFLEPLKELVHRTLGS